MHLGVPLEAPLSRLDSFLRRTWLECCEHMSVFTIDGKRYYPSYMGRTEGLSMEVRTGRVLRDGLVFSHQYDFGSTTELVLKVVGEWIPAESGSVVELLARNDPPEVVCDACGEQPAVQICTECDWGGEGWLCEACAESHSCGSDSFLPVVNSPRVGVCGYSG
jgi:hypothetical protein